jgi:hypothetical protein
MSDTRFIGRPSVNLLREEFQTTLRLKDSPTIRTWPRLVALGLVLSLAVLVFLTKGGPNGFYSATYDQLRGTEELLQKISAVRLPLVAKRGTTEKYQLQGIIYSSLRPMAVINQQACTPGESVSVPVGRADEIIHCVEITPGTVEIRTSEGRDTRLSLP